MTGFAFIVSLVSKAEQNSDISVTLQPTATKNANTQPTDTPAKFLSAQGIRAPKSIPVKSRNVCNAPTIDKPLAPPPAKTTVSK